MNNVIQFPINKFYLPKKRVFYIGFRYVGSVPCQEVQNLFLKRKGLVQGIRWWAMITYAKYDENDSNKYSIELKQCKENDVPDMLCDFDVGGDVTFLELMKMGWKGLHPYSAEIVRLRTKGNNN